MSLSLLLDHVKQTSALSQVAGLISWDQETMMPKAGATARAEQSGAMAGIIHGRNADPRVADWLAVIDENNLSAFDRRNVAEVRKAYEKATKIPASLAEEIAKAASEGQRIWAEAREAKNYRQFAPALQRNVELKRQEAACLSEAEMDLYDALLDDYEPRTRTSDLLTLLESLREPLRSLRERIAQKNKPPLLTGYFPSVKQMDLAREISTLFGYNFDGGRLDTSTHPFTSGVAQDVRITTRIDETDPLNCLYSTAHEVGHALYAQGATDAFLPAGGYCSMGVHESQSRFWENQIARSRPFMDWLYPKMKQAFGNCAIKGPDLLYRAINRVETGFIRTEADEVHYNLHVLLRFDLERRLISGDLDAVDLEEAWNVQFEQDFGLKVTDPSLGVLQDVHWSVALFGYFPTYSLGNIYSACLDEAMCRDIPDRDDLVRQGEMASVLAWLREKIHDHGRLLEAPDLIRQATGEKPTTKPLIDYLERKFVTLYDL